MKRMKLFSIVAAFIAALAFTSCNTDSEGWTPLTPEQMAQAHNLAQGSYYGKMVYYSKDHVSKSHEGTDVADTLYTVSWSIESTVNSNGQRDTLMTIRNFPVNIFAQYIKEEANNKAMIEALKASQESVSLASDVYYYQLSPLLFLINPQVIKVPLKYDGADHMLSIYFYSSSIYGIWNYGSVSATNSKKVCGMYLYAGGYKIDAKDDDKTEPTRFNFTVGNEGYEQTTMNYATFMIGNAIPDNK